MPAVANTSSHGSHGGGFIAVGASPLRDNGIRVLMVGDIYDCPIHGPNPVVTGSSVWRNTGRPIVRVGDSTACGASVTPPASPEWSSS